VDLVEDLGSDRFLHVNCDGIDVVARAGRERTIRPEGRIDLHAATEQVHFFVDDKRIEP